MTKPDARLSRARAYWRLAAKADRAGQSARGRQYRAIADRLHAEYLRNREYVARMKAGQS